ncbi:MAG: cytochrome b/b6 domain-containing protein [Halodesulfurarchaeum sp.]
MSKKRTDGGLAEEAVGSHEASQGFFTRLWLKVARRYERYQYLDESDKEVIDIHGYGTIISHWALLVFMITTTLTGLSKWLGVYGPLDIGIWGGYNPAFLTHVWTGVFLAVVAFILYPFYAFVVDKKQFVMNRKQIEEQIIITLAFVGLASYIPGYKKSRRCIEEETGHWIGHHPMQTAFWYVTWFFVGLLTLSGFALWANLSIDPASWVSALGFMQAWFGFEALLRIHLVATAWVLAAVALHAYFALMPSNWDILKLMLDGNLYGWLISEEDKPELEGKARSKDAMPRPLAGISRLFGTEPEIQDQVSAAEDGPETESKSQD